MFEKLILSMAASVMMFVAPVSAQTSYTINASSTVNPVTKEHFGVNLLAPDDRTVSPGTFGVRALGVNSKLIRWPGGGLAETRMRMTPADINNSQWETSLTQFLAFAKNNSLTPTIVVPTKRYRGNLALATTEVGNLVRRVTNNEFGTINVPIWEVGNEFFVNESSNPASWGSSLSYSQYGEIARHIANVIRSEAKYPVKISIQAGQNAAPSSTLTSNVNDLKSHFTTTSHDLLTMHAYPANFTKNNDTFMFRNLNNMKTLWGNLAKPYYISEWNVRNCTPPPYPNPDCGSDMTTRDLGMAQGTAMLESFSSFIRVGTHAAAGWPLQRDNFTGYFRAEGQGNNTPFIGGKVFSWLSEVIGMNMISVTPTGTTDKKIQVVAFSNANKMVVFVNNGLAGPQNIFLSLSNFQIGSYSGRRLYYTSNVDDRIVPLETGAGVATTGPNTNVIRVPLAVYGDNEMVKITINRK